MVDWPHRSPKTRGRLEANGIIGLPKDTLRTRSRLRIGKTSEAKVRGRAPPPQTRCLPIVDAFPDPFGSPPPASVGEPTRSASTGGMLRRLRRCPCAGSRRNVNFRARPTVEADCPPASLPSREALERNVNMRASYWPSIDNLASGGEPASAISNRRMYPPDRGCRFPVYRSRSARSSSPRTGCAARSLPGASLLVPGQTLTVNIGNWRTTPSNVKAAIVPCSRSTWGQVGTLKVHLHRSDQPGVASSRTISICRSRVSSAKCPASWNQDCSG